MSAKGHYFSKTQPGNVYGGVIVWAYTHDETRDGRYGIMRALHAGLAGKAYDKAKCQMNACQNPDGTCAALKQVRQVLYVRSAASAQPEDMPTRHIRRM